jgi:hypothetical protein
MSALTTSSSSLLHSRNQMLTCSSTNRLDQVFIDDEVQRFDADSYRQKYGERWKRLATSVRDVLQNDGTIIREYVIEDPSLLDQLTDDENDEITTERKPCPPELHDLPHQPSVDDLRTFTAYPTNTFDRNPTNEPQMRHEHTLAMVSAHDMQMFSNSQNHLSNQHTLMSLKNSTLTNSNHNNLNRNWQEECQHQQTQHPLQQQHPHQHSHQHQHQQYQQATGARQVLTTFESAKQVSRGSNEPIQASQTQFTRYFQPIYSRNELSHEPKPQELPIQHNDVHHHSSLQMTVNVKPNEANNQGVSQQQIESNFSSRTIVNMVVSSKHEDDEIVDKEVEVIHEKGFNLFSNLFNLLKRYYTFIYTYHTQQKI